MITPVNDQVKFSVFRQPHSHTDQFADLLAELIPLMYPNVLDNTTVSREYHTDWNAFTNSTIHPSPAPPSQTIFNNETSETIGTTIVPPISDIGANLLCKHSLNEEASPEHMQALIRLLVMLEGVLQFTVGIIGIISNLLAIPVLCGSCMKSIFNKLLICLLILHTIYIISSLVTVVIWPPWNTNEDNTILSSTPLLFITLFRFVLRPLNHMMLFSSIFITVLMARQRYLAIRHPIEYRNVNRGGNLWIPAIKNLIGVLIIAAMFTWSIFLETDVKLIEGEPVIIDINETHFQFVRAEKLNYFYFNVY